MTEQKRHQWTRLNVLGRWRVDGAITTDLVEQNSLQRGCGREARWLPEGSESGVSDIVECKDEVQAWKGGRVEIL